MRGGERSHAISRDGHWMCSEKDYLGEETESSTVEKKVDCHRNFP